MHTKPAARRLAVIDDEMLIATLKLLAILYIARRKESGNE